MPDALLDLFKVSLVCLECLFVAFFRLITGFFEYADESFESIINALVCLEIPFLAGFRIKSIQIQQILYFSFSLIYSVKKGVPILFIVLQVMHPMSGINSALRANGLVACLALIYRFGY